MNRRLFGFVLMLGLFLAACGEGAGSAETTEPTTTTIVAATTTTLPPTTTTVPPTTTTTLSSEELAAIQLEQDVAAIKTLWRRFSDSWSASSEAGYQYITDHNHLLEECSGEDWKAWKNPPPEYWMEIVIDDTTIERDDGWPLPSGPNAGAVPEGRIYIHQTTITDGAPSLQVGEQTLEGHTVIAPDGTANFFFGC